MNNQPKPSAEQPAAVDVAKAISVDEKRARLLEANRKKDAAAAEQKLDAEIARLDLVERFERELRGKEGHQFAVHDASDCGEGLFVVKLGPAILWKTYWDSPMTDVDKCDLVVACIVHPAKDEYLAARGRRLGIDAELVKHLARLNGLDIQGESKK